MARPRHFSEANTQWIGEGDIGALPVYREKDENISCWKLTIRERILILLTGSIWLHVWGDHPAVYISGWSPFGPS